MKFLAITALLVAGTLAMPASNSCPPPGGDHNPPPPPSHPTPSYPPPPPTNNGGSYPPPPPANNGGSYPPPPDSSKPAPPPPNYTPPHHGDGGDGGHGGGDGGHDGGSGNTGGGNTDGGDSDDGGDGNHFECPRGLYSNPQCCSVGVLGLADLDCSVPNKTPKDGKDFGAICKNQGSKEAQCCVLPVAGQAVLCQDVVGSD
ncbi:hydrophobin [Trichoderma evansii]